MDAKYERRKVSQLTNWVKNPRAIDKNDFERLKKSITKKGIYKPLLVNQDNIVLGGNMRLKAFQELGIDSVMCSIVETKNETEMVEYALSDNDRHGFYQDQELAELIASVPDLELEDYKIDLGKPIDLKELLDKFGPEPVEDEAPEVSDDEPESKLGEVYQLGRHYLMCGDSTKIEDVEKLMNGQKADMVFTDPPYGIDFQSNYREKTPQFEKIKNDDVVLEITPIIFSYLKDNAPAYICTRWDLYPQWYQQIQQALDIKNCIVWYKKGGGLGDLANSYSPNHEFIIVAHKGKAELRGKRDADVWEIGRDGFNDYDHPTQKPVALSAFAINHHSDNQNIILDLFGGSGSTLIACEQTNRTCYMMELDPKYIDVIRKRYAKFIGKESEWLTITPKIR